MIYITGHLELLDEIGEMWEMTRLHHHRKSVHFKKIIENVTFSDRKKELLNKCHNDEMFIIIVKQNNISIGYCVSILVDNEAGIIESIFILPEHRKKGIARTLIEKSLKWLKEKECTKITLEVAVGNEEVLLLYEKFGFYPKSIELMQKN